MSVPIELAQLHEEIGRYGPHAHLVSVNASGEPHVVSVLVHPDGDRLVTGAGRTTAVNISTNPAVTLLWAAPPGEDYSLIVDGTAGAPDDRVVVRPTAAVRHRVATAEGEGPSCIKVMPG